MTILSLLLETLRYYWRTNLAVWLGVVVGTAVLAGALLVGDSVRGSLRQMTLDRLGEIDHVLNGPRFFREDLAAELSKADTSTRFAPAIVLTTTIERREANSPQVLARAGRVNLYGVDNRFQGFLADQRQSLPQDDEILLSSRVADQLGVSAGGDLTLVMELPAAVPRDSLLGQRDETSVSLPVKVKAVLPEASGLGRLGLHPDQQLPANAFVSLKTLQQALSVAGGPPVGDPPQPNFARCNTIFAGVKTSEAYDASDAAPVNQALARTWKLADLDLRVRIPEERRYFSLESRRMILDPLSEATARKVAGQQKLLESPVLVYLANELTAGTKNAFSRYSAVAGVDPALFSAKPPFGPFEFVGERPSKPLGEGQIASGGPGEIVLNDWLAADLKAKVGDTVRLTYHVVGSHGELPEAERKFVVQGILKLTGTAADDRGFTPEVHGITDVDSFDDWNEPFPMKKVTTRDDEYWSQHRATPKAFVSLKTAQLLWTSRYGDVTSLRLADPNAKTAVDVARSAAKFETEFLKTLSPVEAGLAFQPVKFQGLEAAKGTNDFSVLFLAFSFFLILSALALISLLFRLGVERRASQLGLLLATGYSARKVRGLLLLEALLVVATGGLAGLLAAVGYASLMLYGLKTWWYGAIGTRFLYLHVQPLSLLIGFSVTAVFALLAVWWRLRDLSKIPVRALLGGVTASPLSTKARQSRGRWSAVVAIVSLTIALALSTGVIAHVIPAGEAFMAISWPTVCFMVAGILSLTAAISGLAAWIDSDRTVAVRGQGPAGFVRLGLRNAGRQKARSVLTAGLIASATFLIVAVAAGQRNPAAETPAYHSGNGGFTLVAESSVPVLQNLNDAGGRAALGLDDPDSAAALALLRQAVAFRVNPGENASCLNIYATSQPTILGVPPDMIQRGGFEFADARVKNPWTLLESADRDGTIPVFGDMNTLQYSLHKEVGSILEIRDEQNRPAKVRVAGMLDGSVFQGVLLMGETHFRKLFPSRGYQYFLLDLAAAVPAEIQSVVPERAGAPKFSQVPAEVWSRLDRQEGNALPVAANRKFVEGTLGLSEGAVVNVTSNGKPAGQIALAVLLDETAAPNRLLMSSRVYEKHLSPSPGSVPVELRAPPTAARKVADALESKIPGFDTEPVADRLANFLAVQNTYLSTFATLGGLGLLLGTIGLGTVMLRNVLERRSELALLRAVGFTAAGLTWLVLAENALLLIWGLLTGTASALIAMGPHLLTTGADFSWAGTGLMLLAVFAVGMLAALLSLAEALRTPVLQTLRAE